MSSATCLDANSFIFFVLFRKQVLQARFRWNICDIKGLSSIHFYQQVRFVELRMYLIKRNVINNMFLLPTRLCWSGKCWGAKNLHFTQKEKQNHIFPSILMAIVKCLLFCLPPLCRSILRTYAHDDVSAGSWFIGLDVKHVDEGKFCCASWSSGLSLSPRYQGGWKRKRNCFLLQQLLIV